MKLIEELEAYKNKIYDYCNSTADFKNSSKHSYIVDKIDSLIKSIAEFELHDGDYCPLYDGKILPDENNHCSLCGGEILPIKEKV